MDLKKSPRANLESKRTTFFLVGLSIALFAAVTVLQWTTSFTTPLPEEPDQPDVFESSLDIPITVHKLAEAPAKKEEYKANPNKLNPLDEIIKNFLVVPDPIDNNGEEEGEPLDIPELDGDGPDDKDIEVINPMIVQKMALPFECADVSDRKEQEACLNRFIARYLRDNIQYPERLRAMGAEDQVIVSFIINHEGFIENIQVSNGDYEGFNEEAARVISKLPRFSPASHMGRKVKMSMALPVRFKIH